MVTRLRRECVCVPHLARARPTTCWHARSSGQGRRHEPTRHEHLPPTTRSIPCCPLTRLSSACGLSTRNLAFVGRLLRERHDEAIRWLVADHCGVQDDRDVGIIRSPLDAIVLRDPPWILHFVIVI